MTKIKRKIGSDCSGPCLACLEFFLGGNCLAGHGDDHYSPATIKQVQGILDSKQTPGGRILNTWEIKQLEAWIGEEHDED